LIIPSTESFLAVLSVQLLAAGAVITLHRRSAWLRRGLPLVISVAVGVLLGTGVGHLLPEAVESLGNRPAVWVVLVVTMLALYSFERVFHLLSGSTAESNSGEELAQGHHDHHHASRPATLLLGCVLHSVVDGTSVAAAFAAGAFIHDRRIGWVTALAVGLHEIPHRLGDFALLLHLGVERVRAARLAIGAGLSSLLGWAVVVAIGVHHAHAVGWLLPMSAGSFLYISLVDLPPELRQEQRPRFVLTQIVCLAAGVALAVGLSHLPGA
jgi:zinc and cadmium transporter